MKHQLKILIISLILLSTYSTVIERGLYAQPDPNFHIYISIGQSNMEGTGAIADADLTDISPRFLTLSATDYPQRCRARGEWYPAMPPLCREDVVTENPTNRGLGPTDYFGRTMVENTPDSIRIGVICVAVGAAKIEGFYRDINVAQDYYNNQSRDYVREKFALYDYYAYGHILALARQAQQVGTIRGILLHQGESNYGQTDWPLKVKGVYENLLSDLGLEAEKVPLLVGEVTENGPSGGMNKIIRTVPDYIPTAHVISSVGAIKKSWDPIHFDSEGYREMGRRYAATMLQLEGYDTDNIQPLINKAKEYLTYSTAPANQRIALQNAIQQAEAGSSNSNNLTTAIHNFVSGGAKPIAGHPFDLTWMGNSESSKWNGATGTYYYMRQGLSAEFYASDAQKQGIIMHQNINGMPDGTYDIVLHASSSFTSGRGFSSVITTEGGANRTYIYANNVSQMIPVKDVGNNLIYEPHTYVLNGVRVEGGTLEIGLRHDAPGANWDVLQLRRIVLTASSADNTTLLNEFREAQSRAALFSTSPNLPLAFRQSLETQSTMTSKGLSAEELQKSLSRLQDDIEAASRISMATRACLLSRSHAQNLADVPYFEENPEKNAREQYDLCLQSVDTDLSQATDVASIQMVQQDLQQGIYDYITNTSPATGHQFDLTFLLQNPDLTGFITGVKVPGWATEQTDGTLQCRADGSVISPDGRQTFCEFSSNSPSSISAFAAYQTVTLPAGFYCSTALAFATTGQTSVRPIVTFRADNTDGQLILSSTLNTASVDFELSKEQPLNLGLYSHAGNKATRMGIGYMHLYKKPNPNATGIVFNQQKSKNTPFVSSPVFNLQGQKLSDSLDTLHNYCGIVVVRGKKIYIRK